MKLLVQQRPIASPRREFKEQLIAYERSLFGRVTLRLKPVSEKAIERKNRKKKR